MKQKQYQIFDTAEDQQPLNLRITSNKNIKRVIDVLTSFAHADFEERLYYAKAYGEIPVKRDDEGEPITENGNAVVEFENVYLDSLSYWCGLAEAVFIGCPKLGEIVDGEYILNGENQELINGLIRSEVRAGVSDFLELFGLKLYNSNDLFSLFQIDQNATMEAINEVIQGMTKETATTESD